MDIIEQIKNGIGKSEFFLEYMPTISLSDDCCVGAEVLIRWKAGGRMIPPGKFITAVENTPYAGHLTYWVIERVGVELGDWLRANPHAHAAINVPPELIGRGGILRAAQKANLLDIKDQLIMEITERGVPDEQAINTLQEFSHEINVAIDDFGTGDLNLVHVAKLPAHIVKMDKVFVDEIKTEQHIPRIVRGLVAFAKALEAKVIAEGVETETQIRVLKLLGVDMAQGWYFSKSLPREAFIEFHNRYNGS
jgi:sensor c-di-GMP phosphodiesterase-like protein